MTYGSLFSGIGGLDLALEAFGHTPLWQAEMDPYALAVLAKHWPTVRRYNDVKEIDDAAERPDIICGGFPCQPVSVAGSRLGTEDHRWLWPEFARVVAAVKPSIVFIENVPGLRTLGLRGVLGDLADLGFDAEWQTVSAAEAGAPHRRSRIFIFAYANGAKLRLEPWWRSRKSWTDQVVSAEHGQDGAMADANGITGNARRARDASEGACGWNIDRGRLDVSPAHWAIEPDVGRVVDELSPAVDRLRCLGNAVVPAQAVLALEALTARATRQPTTERTR